MQGDTIKASPSCTDKAATCSRDTWSWGAVSSRGCLRGPGADPRAGPGGCGAGGAGPRGRPPARRDPAPPAHSPAGRRPPPRPNPPDRTPRPSPGPPPTGPRRDPSRGPQRRTHHGGGLPDGGHDGGQRGRHVIAAHTPAPPTARRKRKAERAPGRGPRRCERRVLPAHGRALRRVRAHAAPRRPVPRPAPPVAPRVTVPGRPTPRWPRQRAARADLRPAGRACSVRAAGLGGGAARSLPTPLTCKGREGLDLGGSFCGISVGVCTGV